MLAELLMGNGDHGLVNFLRVVLQSFLTSIVQNLFSGENQVFQSSFAAVLLQILFYSR